MFLRETIISDWQPLLKKTSSFIINDLDKANFRSLLNITFIQLSTRHDCFSQTHFNLIFFSLCIIAGFRFFFRYVNPIYIEKKTTRKPAIIHKENKIRSNPIHRTFDLIYRVFASGWEDRGSILGRVMPKTQEMVLDAALLSIQHHIVRIKGKMEQSWEWTGALPYTSV